MLFETGIVPAFFMSQGVDACRAVALREAADDASDASIGTAMMAFYWLQREEDITGRLSWTHYRPTEALSIARIYHHKTRELVDLPLYDDDGTV